MKEQEENKIIKPKAKKCQYLAVTKFWWKYLLKKGKITHSKKSKITD
jgi:hypothetical protein